MSRLELRFGAPVILGERRIGSLDAVILDGAGSRWEAIVVRRGLLRRSRWIAPRSAVSHASDERIVLDAPPTIPTDAPVSRAVDAGTAVKTEDGRRLGRLALLLTRADGRLSHLVIERRSFGARRMAPASLVTAVEPRDLVVDLPHGFEALTPYRPDRDLALLARWAIERLGIPGRFEGIHIHVSAVDGVVLLEGHVTSRLRAARMAAAVATVPGVLAVENRLVCDDELTVAVARALAEGPHTRDHLIRVAAHRGVITLEGRAADAAVAAATRLAGCVPGVRGVVSRLRAPGVRPGRRSIAMAAGRDPAPDADGAKAEMEPPARGRREPQRAA
jgi:hypothetical protein